MQEKFSGVKNLTEFDERVISIIVSEDVEYPYDVKQYYDRLLPVEDIKEISFDMLKTELVEIGDKWAFENFFGVEQFNSSQEKERYCKEKNVTTEQLEPLIDEWKKTYQDRENLAVLRNELRTATLPFGKVDTLWKLEDKFGTNPIETNKEINELLKNQMYQMYKNNLKEIIDSEVREPVMYAKTDILTNEKMYTAAIAKVNQMYSKKQLFKGIEFKHIFSQDKEKFIEELEQTSDEIMAKREKLEELRYLLRANSLKKRNTIEEKNYGDFTIVEKILVRMDESEFYKLETNFGLRQEGSIYKDINTRLNEINPNTTQNIQKSSLKITRTTGGKENR